MNKGNDSIFKKYVNRNVSKYSRVDKPEEDIYIRVEEHFEETIGGETESIAKVYESDIIKWTHTWEIERPWPVVQDPKSWGIATSMDEQHEINKVTLFYVKQEQFDNFKYSVFGHRMGLEDYIEQHGIDIDKMPVKNPDDGPVDDDLVNINY